MQQSRWTAADEPDTEFVTAACTRYHAHLAIEVQATIRNDNQGPQVIVKDN